MNTDHEELVQDINGGECFPRTYRFIASLRTNMTKLNISNWRTDFSEFWQQQFSKNKFKCPLENSRWQSLKIGYKDFFLFAKNFY